MMPEQLELQDPAPSPSTPEMAGEKVRLLSFMFIPRPTHRPSGQKVTSWSIAASEGPAGIRNEAAVLITSSHKSKSFLFNPRKIVR